jgi:hypothetical protein
MRAVREGSRLSSMNRNDSAGRSREGHVQEEYGAPADMLDQPAAEHGPIAAVMALNPDQVPMAFPRSASRRRWR